MNCSQCYISSRDINIIDSYVQDILWLYLYELHSVGIEERGKQMIRTTFIKGPRDNKVMALALALALAGT
jgi:hypothetical protein